MNPTDFPVGTRWLSGDPEMQPNELCVVEWSPSTQYVKVREFDMSGNVIVQWCFAETFKPRVREKLSTGAGSGISPNQWESLYKSRKG